MRVRAGALVITVVISVLLTIVAAGSIAVAYYSRLHSKQQEIANRLRRNISSAINLVLADTSFVVNRMVETDLFSNGSDSVVIRTSRWGIFEMNTITAHHEKFQNKLLFFTGAALPKYMDNCLYLADHKTALSLVGAAKLNGDVVLPKLGIRPGFISQRGFDFDKMVEGEIGTSDENLPALKESQLEYLSNVRAMLFENEVELFNNEENVDTVYRSFEEAPLVMDFSQRSFISNQRIEGKVVLSSDTLLEIDASAALDNVIIIAPVVKFHKGFSGKVQVFARDSIITEANCRFEYPSCFAIFKKLQENKAQPVISIGTFNSFTGFLITHSASNDPYKIYLEVGKDTNVYGVVYSRGYTAIYGSISGAVVADYLVYKTAGQYFENHLVDATLDRRKLSSFFVGADIFVNSGKKEIVEWLD